MVKRELSCFLCRELLYEFATGVIDERRRDAVQEHLDGCLECKKENEALKSSLQYLNKLGHAEINPAYLKEVAEPEPLFKQMLKKIGWQKWPDPIKWTVESVVVGGVLALLIGVVSQKVLLKIQEKEPALYTDTDQAVDVAQTQIPETPADQLQGSENGENPFTGNDEEYVPDQSPTKINGRVESPIPVPSIAEPTVATAPTPSPTTTTAPPAIVEEKSAGFIYRGNINVQDVDTVTPDVVAKIQSLKGKRAGEVGLGWKQPSGSYFHFSMPESGFTALVEHLKQHGNLSIVKEKNRRMMPKGMIRIILNVNGPRTEPTSNAIPPPADMPTPQEESQPAPLPHSEEEPQ